MASSGRRQREQAYYDREMQRLLEEGRRFARRYPGQARSLGLDGIGDVDPMVERLREAFAFLCGKVRERLDDDYPELTSGLLSALWPHYLRPFPATAVVEFTPRMRLWPGARLVPAGVEIEAPDPNGRAPWRFQTRYPVWVQPLRATGSAPLGSRRRVLGVRLNLQVLEGASKKDLDFGRLRFYLHGSRAAALTARDYLLHRVRRVVLREPGPPGEEARVLAGGGAFAPVGLEQDELLLPMPARSFPGYALLQEYFHCPEKFCFVDLVGLSRFDPGRIGPELILEIEFDEAYPENLELSHDTLRLFCAPVVNLFEQRAVPILRDPRRVAQPVRADLDASRGIGVFAILNASGSSMRKGGGRIEYRDLAERRPGDDGELFPGEFFHVERRVHPDTGAASLHLTFADPRGVLPEETVHLDLLCYNQFFPDSVPVHWISSTTGTIPDGLEVDNLTDPTPLLASPGVGEEGPGLDWGNVGRPGRPASMPTRGETHWRLVSHLAVSQASLGDPGVLADMLRLYDWTGDPEMSARIDAVRATSLRPRQFLRRGTLVNGFMYALEVDETAFTNASDVSLFGDVLARFLSQYAALNAAVGLEVTLVGSKQRMQWDARAGSVPPV